MSTQTSTQSPSPHVPGDLIPEIQDALNRVVHLCNLLDRKDLAGRLEEETQHQRLQVPTVVVVGEVKRGKSSLVNALLDEPDLSPVDVDIATSSQIVFHRAHPRCVRVDAGEETGAGEPQGRRPIERYPEVPFDTLFDWASVEGNPGNERDVRAIFVGLEHPLLEAMAIVDTPGVGGLDGGHGRMAVRSALDADVLLFVTDGALSAPELRFLKEISARVRSVVFVLTRADMRTQEECAEIIEANRRLLRHDTPRLGEAPFVPVSSILARRALSGPESDAAAAMTESGVPDLRRLLLGAVSGPLVGLRLANVVRLARSAVDQLEAQLGVGIEALADDDPRVLAALTAEEQRLNELRSGRQGWQQTLEDELRLVGLARTDDLRAGMRQISMRYEERSFSTTGESLDALPGEVLGDVTALTSQLAESTTARIETVLVKVGGELGATEEAFESLTRMRSGAITRDVSITMGQQRGASKVEKMSTLVSLSSGRSLGALVAGLPIFALGGAPFVIAGLGVGAAFAWQMHRGRNQVNRQQQFRGWLSHQISEAQSQLTTDYERNLIEVRTELRTALTRWLEVRSEQVTAARDARRKALEEDREARRARLAAARRTLQDVVGAAGAVDEVSAKIDAQLAAGIPYG